MPSELQITKCQDSFRGTMIEKVIKIARDAGRKVLEIYDSDDFQTKTKADKENSPLTRADLIANETIIEGLKEISDYPIVTEESYVEYETRKQFEKFWLVDPLDGTKDFIAKNGEFTINIALIEHDKPALGVIYVPFLGLMYWAERGKGAYKNGERIYNDTVG